MRIIKILICFIALSLTLSINPTYAEKAELDYESMSIPTLIETVVKKENQAIIKKIVYCESGNKKVVHDGGHGVGVTGFHKKTFDAWNKKFGTDYDYNTNYGQIMLMDVAFSKGEEYRKAWTTYVAYKKGGTYTFYSKLLGKTFTVKCS